MIDKALSSRNSDHANRFPVHLKRGEQSLKVKIKDFPLHLTTRHGHSWSRQIDINSGTEELICLFAETDPTDSHQAVSQSGRQSQHSMILPEEWLTMDNNKSAQLPGQCVMQMKTLGGTTICLVKTADDDDGPGKSGQWCCQPLETPLLFLTSPHLHTIVNYVLLSDSSHL